MNTPLILMTAALIVAIICWIMARNDVALWRRRSHDSQAARAKLLDAHLSTLVKLWILQEAEGRRKHQRLAALDKANAANRAKRAKP